VVTAEGFDSCYFVDFVVDGFVVAVAAAAAAAAVIGVGVVNATATLLVTIAWMLPLDTSGFYQPTMLLLDLIPYR
jgi:hypothetical protein